ncbi:protein O-mannosyl-transferase family [Phnomibacter sp. MR]|uniref:protein O-mannosyl-transferase family n=1 Tax=Phnomibacter sp. MR TaxID=3042318 RepID=UPI003A808DD6
MKFNRLNNIVGWIVFLIASTVYIMTAEKNGSLWDCGEFVASCFKLQIPHPPGAPMFVLIGRFFIVLFGDDPATAAKAVNIMSALASSFTILFLFWTITHFARKLVNPVVETINDTQALTIMGAGVVGALAYTFSDSFWYSAVEGEVYALSSFFTALVFWAMLKWEHQVDKDARTDAGTGHSNADRWIVFIFFMMGLSIGVHLLNLLTIPAIVMIYYFKRYSVTKWGTFWAFVIGCVITGLVQKFVIQYSIKGAGHFDIMFVNDFGLPFFSGFTTFFALLAIAIWFGLRIAAKKGWYYLRLGLWCLTFMLIGYSSYLTTMIRSSADPGVDMYNVDNPMSLVGYLGREQYGDFPLVYGQVFTAQSRNTSREEGAMRYQKSKENYIELGNDVKEVYDPADMMFFPRVWDRSNDQQHANYYADVLGIGRTDDPKMQSPETGPYERRPTFADNIRFFVGYQTYWMYLRYFMWNFAGKQNDVQGVYASNVRDGNWITGISFIDDLIYGPQSAMPETAKNNKANNKLMGLPLILGLFGLFFQYYRHRKDFLVNGLLFFFTGMAIVVYLNQAGNQPRERDYAYVGSFYAFAVWIGLAVPAFVLLAKENALKLLQKILMGAGVVYLLAAMSGSIATQDGKAFIGLALLGVVGTAVVAGIFFLLKALKSEKAIATGAFAITLLAAPAWMATQEWDDHDRSNKTMAPDLAVDYLNSCAPNAILFSFGDNDTYPLWYAQEVMGIRRDVRVINYSLLGIDWYINQLRYKVNASDAMDVIWSAEQIEGDKLNYALYQPRPGYEGPQNLYSILKDWVGTADMQKMYTEQGEPLPIYPTNSFYLPVDKNLVLKNGTVKATDAVVDTVQFQVPKQIMFKNDLAVLAVIASNNFKRPIYFTSKFDELGFQNYLRRDGMTYRLVPVAGDEVNTEWAYEKMMKEFKFGNAETAGVYFDEENRRHLNNLRQAYADVAISLTNKGQKDSAQKLLQRVDKMMDSTNMPYGLISRYALHNQTSLMLMEAAYRAGDEALAQKIGNAVRKELNQEMAYFAAIGDKRLERMQLEFQRSQMMLQMLDQMEEVLKRSKAPVVEGPVKIGGDSNALPGQ